MILQLRIHNFAIIEELQIEFHEGFNVLTGETGAGKSILLDALGLLLGDRGSIDFIRHGETKAEIEGLFSLQENSLAMQRLVEMGISVEDELIVIRRELTIQGKSVCRINGQLVTIAMLKQVGEAIVNFHSQHDHHQLLQAQRHLFWLDAFAGEELHEQIKEYQQVFRGYLQARKELERLTANEKEIAQRIDLLKYQIEEIESAHLETNEDVRLLEEKTKLVHAEKIMKGVHSAYSALADDERSLDWLGSAMSQLEDLIELDPTLKNKYQQIEESFYILDEIKRDLGAYLDKNDFDVNRLDVIEDRLHMLNSLKRKYGDTLMDIITYSDTCKKELEQLENRDTMQANITKKLREQKLKIFEMAKKLTDARKSVATILEESVKRELNELHMENAEFSVQIKDLSIEFNNSSLDIPGGDLGMNEVEFLITTNPGEPLKPLSKVASGGELSRLALALRTVLARIDEVNTLVFDEVDTGVSGRITHAIGEKLLRISKERQVLAITHHPQVASLANNHFLIEKNVTGDRTTTGVKKLGEEERVVELARMIGGSHITNSAKLHALEMRKLGKQINLGK